MTIEIILTIGWILNLLIVLVIMFTKEYQTSDSDFQYAAVAFCIVPYIWVLFMIFGPTDKSQPKDKK